MSISRLIAPPTSRRRSPSTLRFFSICSRSFWMSSSLRSLTRISGSTPVTPSSRTAVGRPMPKIYVRAISMRFSRGRSMPAILAIVLSLRLLVLRVLADHTRATRPLDDLAFVTDLLDRWSDFHHLYLYVIRPWLRSYGESSTSTRSPGKMRMKFMRILPETRASTRWPFCSSTRKKALGSGSTTTPSTSMASSLGDAVVAARASFFLAERLCMPPRLRANRASFRHRPVNNRQNLVAVLRDRDRVLEVRRQLAVGRDHSPFVGLRVDLPAALVHHRLDCEDHARFEFGPRAALAEIRHLGLFVQLLSDAVADKLTHDRIAARFDKGLHRVSDVRDVRPGPNFADSHVERFFGRFEQRCRFGRDLAHADRAGHVGVPAVHDRPDINLQKIAVTQDPVARNPVNHFFVQRKADRPGETVVAQECRLAAKRADRLLGEAVDLARRDSGRDASAKRRERLRVHSSAGPHLGELLFRSAGDHDAGASTHEAKPRMTAP